MKIFTEIFSKRELLATLISRNLKIRYQSSVLGFFWTLLNPLFMMLIYWIFIKFMKFPIDPASLLTGILAWQFLTMCCSDSVNSVAGHPNLVKKVYFPRMILPISTVMANFINYLLSLLILFAFTLAIGSFAWGTNLALLPLVILLQLVFCMGLAFLISCSSIYFKDTEHIIGVLLMAWFFMSPVIYTLNLIAGNAPAWVLPIYQLNPMVGIITLYRRIIINGPAPSLLATAASIAAPFIFLAIGVAVFRRHEPDFADEL